MKYTGCFLKKEIDIEKVFSVHYFEYTKDFAYDGEQHDFWEFVYVDKGSIDVIAGKDSYTLKKSDIIFHKPNEFHNLAANGRIAPNIIVISFSCRTVGVKWFNNKILHIGNEEKNLLARIIHEAGNAFSSDLSDPWMLQLQRNEVQPFASEQLIKLYLEQFLISMARKDMHITRSDELASPLKEKSHIQAFQKVIHFFDSHITENPNLESICLNTGYSCTYLQNVFKERTGKSIMEYYKIAKLEKAKDLIREGDYTFTQIASVLNYSSLHYFSKIFKRYIGMTPSEYSLSVKLKM